MAPRDPDNINVRLGDEALAALDRLVAARQQEARPGMKVTRSDVIREAIHALEAADKKRRRK